MFSMIFFVTFYIPTNASIHRLGIRISTIFRGINSANHISTAILTHATNKLNSS